MIVRESPSIVVAVTNNGNHTPEQWAQLCVRQIMAKAVAVPGASVEEKALDRDRLASIIANYITMALEAETLAGQSIARGI